MLLLLLVTIKHNEATHIYHVLTLHARNSMTSLYENGTTVCQRLTKNAVFSH